ncbi:MAG: trigger factor [Lachnospiraceae bacterium]|nr:trigger factor [Lachnospiraceae bacterium]
MSVNVENLEHNMAKLTFTVSAADLEKAMQAAYQKNKGKFSVPGFRKGHVPRAIIEKMYGKMVFFEDAVNEVLPEAYEAAVKESGVEVVSRPDINLAGAPEPGKDIDFTATVALKPPVTLGEYKGMEVDKAEVSVSDEDVDKEIETERNKNSVMNSVERPAQLTDQVVIDYLGEIDGVPFEGGADKDFSLLLGSHTFIEGFEEQLVGAVAGEQRDVSVTFPAEYHAAELAGKPAVFHVTVKEVKEKVLPELNDEFASDVSEFETLEEYRADVRAKLEKRAADAAKTAKENAAVEKAVANAEIDIPQPMIDSQAQTMLDDYLMRMEQQGISREMFFQYSGQTEDKMLEDIRPDAERRIRSRLTLEAIAAAEGLVATDEDVDKEIEDMAKAYGMDVERLRPILGEDTIESLRHDAVVKKAIDLVAEAAKEV